MASEWKQGLCNCFGDCGTCAYLLPIYFHFHIYRCMYVFSPAKSSRIGMELSDENSLPKVAWDVGVRAAWFTRMLR